MAELERFVAHAAEADGSIVVEASRLQRTTGEA
jgi:hypothetical protein